MIPLLTLIAYYAPAGHRATWFALMASLMNLALVAGPIADQVSSTRFSWWTAATTTRWARC